MTPDKDSYPWGALVAALCFALIAVMMVVPYALR